MGDCMERPINPCRCHIDVLPDEILSVIQSIATDAQIGDDQRYRFPSTLCWISQHWRRVALETPRIWSFIFISSAHAVEYLEGRLAKTGVVPLDIKIHDSKSLLDHYKVMKTLLTVHARWRSFSLQTAQIEKFAPHLPESLAFLESITFTDTLRRFKIMTLFPKLKYMTLSSSSLFWGPYVTFVNLVEFHVLDSGWHRVTLEKMLRLLQNCPNLEVLDLSEPWTFRPVPAEESQALLSQTAILPQLRTMALKHVYAWEFTTLLSWIRAPTLQSLTVTIVKPGVEVVRAAPPSVYTLHLNFPSLQKLTLIDTELPGDEICHILLQLPKVPVLALISTEEPAMDFILNIILNDPALAEIGGIHICGIPTPDIHRCLSHPLVPRGPRSLIFQSKWKIYRAIVDDIPIKDEENRLLTELRSLVPALEVEYEGLESD